MLFVLNIAVSACVIAFASWLSGRYPVIAGFMVALPLATMLVLPLSYLEHRNAENTIEMARSIFVAIPISLLFFVPFLFSEQLKLSFWPAYAFGVLALPVGFGIHRLVTRLLF